MYNELTLSYGTHPRLGEMQMALAEERKLKQAIVLMKPRVIVICVWSSCSNECGRLYNISEKKIMPSV